MNGTILRWLAVWWLSTACALADGGFVAKTAFAKVQIPDQRALIHFANGTETLVIDTSFKGEGTNFAWIVPVPSVPKIEAATRGLFPTLQTLFRPNVEHSVPRVFLFALSLGLIIATFIWRIRSGGSFLIVLAFWIVVILLIGLMLPAISSAGVTASSSGVRVNVLERQTVGVFDTVTLSSKDGSAVVHWLGENGFATPTNFLPAIRAYAAEGWVFVASKVNPSASLAEAKAHPLILKFETQKPVYPLRLTGIGNASCGIDLYVFGPRRAQVPNFEVERCAQVVYPSPTNNWHLYFNTISIHHPLLRKLVESSPVGTKLTARLTPGQMNEDAYIAWEDFAPKRLTVYSRHGAAICAANYTVPFVVLAILVDFAAVGRKKDWTKKVSKIALLAALGAALCWVPIYLWLPKVEVFTSWRPWMMNNMMHRQVSMNLLIKWHDQDVPPKAKPDLEWLRQHLTDPKLWTEASPRTGQTNLLSGQLCREEDSPGNYILREKNGDVEYVVYDINGAEQVQTLWSSPP